jgi:hypothetical protein
MRLSKKGLLNDRSGGIEGLPLQLLIMVLIAGVGTAIILGWMGGLQGPITISAVHASVNEVLLEDEDQDGIFTGEDIEIIITVLDQNGDPIEGASVMLDGGGLLDSSGKHPHGVTDDQGKVALNGMSASHIGRSMSFVTVTAAKSGISASRSITIPVVCA